APSELSGQGISGSEIEISWSDNSNNEIAFILERQNDSGEWQELNRINPDINSCIDKNLQPAGYYNYRIKAVNSAGSSGYSNEISVTTFDEPVPVTDLSWEVISASQIKVEWEDISNEDSYMVELFECTENGEIIDGEALDTQVLLGNITYYYFVNLEPGKEYKARVTSINGQGDKSVESDIIRTAIDPKGGLL
ncbi:MAG: fibronectin type III domain-containing protein, partial [Halanaerobiales bacterium]